MVVPLDIGLRSHTREFAEAWQHGTPLLRFTPEEEATGRRLARAIGIPAGASYVCLGLRETAYYQQFVAPGARARDLNTEANEETSIRNPPLGHYLRMAGACAARGLYVLRMGQIVGEPLASGLHPNIIDYATKHRTPFGDMYLLATCRFVVSGGAGLWQVTSAFNRPAVLTDSYWLQFRPLREGDLFIPKKLWVIAEKRLLTFREMLAAYVDYSYASACRRDGIELVHNTPDEIAAVVLEMEERLAGTWVPQGDDEELWQRLDALYQPGPYGHGKPGAYGYGMPGRMGAEFLRENRHLLEER
jgi:putative glycosyltransferase (TIGR04372 family)